VIAVKRQVVVDKNMRNQFTVLSEIFV